MTSLTSEEIEAAVRELQEAVCAFDIEMKSINDERPIIKNKLENCFLVDDSTTLSNIEKIQHFRSFKAMLIDFTKRIQNCILNLRGYIEPILLNAPKNSDYFNFAMKYVERTNNIYEKAIPLIMLTDHIIAECLDKYIESDPESMEDEILNTEISLIYTTKHY